MPEPAPTTKKPVDPRAIDPKTAIPGLIPANPLSGWQALIQVVLLFGVPLGLLLLARYVLIRFFPSLGY